MNPRLLLLAVGLLPCLAACGGGEGNPSANETNVVAAEGVDLNSAIGGDELSPIPEAADDMIANNSAAANRSGNAAAPVPAPVPARPPAQQPR